MQIAPQTNVRLLSNVPLDNTYDHTLYFASASAQYNYFAGQTKYNLVDYTYQRHTKGVCRVQRSADSLYDVNYMMFQNTSYGNKWFYAFVLDVEYINDSTADVYFELDVLQTWHFNYSLDWCFVEREHSATDVVGEHIEPEPVSTTEWVLNGYYPVVPLIQMCVVIAVVDNAEATDGQIYDGIYGSAQLWVYYASDVEAINAKVNEYVQKPDAIIGMYMVPYQLLESMPESHRIPRGTRAKATYESFGGISGNEKLDGYLPKNKKMYTYPYNFLHVDNAGGSSLELRFEFFEGRTARVELSGTITQPVTVALRPVAYKGSQHGNTEKEPTYNCEILTLENYPMCSWNVDAYQAWIAQNGVGVGVSLGGSLIGGIAQILAGDPGRGISTVLDSAISNVAQAYQASIAADMSKGTLNNGGVNVSNQKQMFYWGRASVSNWDARRIDDFFTRFGYSVGRTKIPNRNARPHYTYCKTAGCTITGSVPAGDAKKICDIYNSGITWWKNASEVGNYGLDNSVQI